MGKIEMASAHNAVGTTEEKQSGNYKARRTVPLALLAGHLTQAWQGHLWK